MTPFFRNPVSSTISTPAGSPEVLDHVLTHIVTDGADVPVRPPQQPLHPVWRHITGPLSQGPPVLPPQARDQPTQVLPRPPTRLRPAKPHPDPSMELIQFRIPTIDINVRHELTNEPEPKTIRLLPMQY